MQCMYFVQGVQILVDFSVSGNVFFFLEYFKLVDRFFEIFFEVIERINGYRLYFVEICYLIGFFLVCDQFVV